MSWLVRSDGSVREAERRVERRLVRRRYRAPRGVAQLVVDDGEASRGRVLAQLAHVVGAPSGAPQRQGEAGWSDAVQVETRAVDEAKGDRGAADADGIAHTGDAREAGRYRRWSASALGHDVDVAYHLAPAPHRAGHHRARHLRMTLHRGDESLRFGHRLGVEHVGARLPQVADPLEDLLGRFGPEAWEIGQAPVTRRFLELLHRLDPQPLVDLMDLGGAEPRNAHHLEKPLRRRLEELVEVARLAHLAQLGDDAERRGPEAAQRLHLPRPEERAHVVRLQRQHRASGRLVGAGLVAILAVQLEELADLVEYVRDGARVHR
jgi:hypothetical protein